MEDEEALRFAARNGDIQRVQELLQTGTNVNANDDVGFTPLHRACSNGHEVIARLLLEHGADVDATDETGRTPLHRACWFGYEAVVRLLLERGADVHAENNYGETPLHYACKKTLNTVVSLLLENEADIQAEDTNRLTSLYHACKCGAVHALSTFSDLLERDTVNNLFLKIKEEKQQKPNPPLIGPIRQVVTSISCKIPWDRELTRLAADCCNVRDRNYAEQDDLMASEILRMYKTESNDCKYHLPLGMLLSHVVAQAIGDVWPDFLNKCRCSLARNDSVLLEALQFVESMLLQNMAQHLSPETMSWLVSLVGRIKMGYFQTFQSFLMCISVSDGNDMPLHCLQGDDETRISLKRHIAEFVGFMALKQDVLQLVCCLLTLPSKFPSSGLAIPAVDPFWCRLCGEQLDRLKEKHHL